MATSPQRPPSPTGPSTGWSTAAGDAGPGPLAVRYLAGVLALVAATAFALTGSPVRPTQGPVGVRVDPAGVYNPVLAGEALPDGFRQILPRDAIAPVYDPTFVNGRDIGWSEDAQVIGVAIDGEAKAYPVSFLNGREMVVDEIAGIPILVTW